jgi:hypothetical protein
MRGNPWILENSVPRQFHQCTKHHCCARRKRSRNSRFCPFVSPSKEIVMTDNDHNRSNNTGTGAKTLERDAELPTPSHSGSSGGGMQRDIGARDEVKTAPDIDGDYGDPTPTSVHKGDRPNGGDEPNLPQRDGGGESGSSRRGLAPKRT